MLYVMPLIFLINPEINRRRKEGTLPEDFFAYAIQVIFDDDLECVQVRLNEEVKAVFLVVFRPGC